MHEHGWPPGPRDRHGWHPGRVRSGGTGRPEGRSGTCGSSSWRTRGTRRASAPVRRPVPGPDATADGALLENYYAIGHSSAANYVAQVSGQARDLGTQSDCLLWFPFAGQVIAGPYHQVLGEGCVYPAAVQTLGNQLSAAGRSWAAYLQDMGNDPARDTTVTTARGPAVDYNHYSLLRTVEDIFGLQHLGDAAMPQVRSFGPDVLG